MATPAALSHNSITVKLGHLAVVDTGSDARGSEETVTVTALADRVIAFRGGCDLRVRVRVRGCRGDGKDGGEGGEESSDAHV